MLKMIISILWGSLFREKNKVIILNLNKNSCRKKASKVLNILTINVVSTDYFFSLNRNDSSQVPFAPQTIQGNYWFQNRK